MTIYERISKIKDLNSLEELRKAINEACDNRAEFIMMCNKANDLSERSFGYIKEAFENLSPVLFESKDGKKLINKYTKTIKENKNLSEMHTIYENVRKMHNGSDLDFFIDGMVSNNWNVNKKTLSEDVNKLGKILAEAYMVVGEKSDELLPEDNAALNKALEFIAENKRTGKNITDYSNAVKIIREHVEAKEKVNMHEMFEDVDKIAERLINEFNKKYEEELGDDEKSALKELSENNDKESVFDKYKTMCQEKLKEEKDRFINEGDEESAEKIGKIYEQVGKKVFSENTVGTDICNLIEMVNVFSK